MPYTYNTMLAALRERLNDQNDRFWSEREKLLLLWETLTIFNSITAYWQVPKTFPFTQNLRVLDYTLPDSLLPQTSTPDNPIPSGTQIPTRLTNDSLVKLLTKLVTLGTNEPEVNADQIGFDWKMDSRLISGMYSDSEGRKGGENEFGEGLGLLSVFTDALAEIQRDVRLTCNWYEGTNASRQVNLWSDSEFFGVASVEGLVVFSERPELKRYNKKLKRSNDNARFKVTSLPNGFIDRGYNGIAAGYEVELLQDDRPFAMNLHHFFGAFTKFAQTYEVKTQAESSLASDLANGQSNLASVSSYIYGSQDWAKAVALTYSPITHNQFPLMHYKVLHQLFSRGGFAQDTLKADIVKQFVDFLTVIARLSPQIVSNTASLTQLFSQGITTCTQKVGFLRNMLFYTGELPQETGTKILQRVYFNAEIPIPEFPSAQLPTSSAHFIDQMLYLTEFLAAIKLGGAELQTALTKLETFMAFVGRCLSDKQRTLNDWITLHSRFVNGRLDAEGIESYSATFQTLTTLDGE